MKAVKLNQKQLRSIVAEELKRVHEAGDPGFEIHDVYALVDEDAELFEQLSNLIGYVAGMASEIAMKEGLVPPEKEGAFADACMEMADNQIRDAVYDFLKEALKHASTAGKDL